MEEAYWSLIKSFNSLINAILNVSIIRCYLVATRTDTDDVFCHEYGVHISNMNAVELR